MNKARTAAFLWLLSALLSAECTDSKYTIGLHMMGGTLRVRIETVDGSTEHINSALIVLNGITRGGLFERGSVPMTIKLPSFYLPSGTHSLVLYLNGAVQGTETIRISETQALMSFAGLELEIPTELKPVLPSIRESVLGGLFFLPEWASGEGDFAPMSGKLLQNPQELGRWHQLPEPFLEFERFNGEFTPDFVFDWVGVKTNASWDCGVLDVPYLNVPTRDVQCAAHFLQAHLAAGVTETDPSVVPNIAPSLPLIDEEIFEWLSVLDSVRASSGEYVVVELGARYGTWLMRAGAAHRQLYPDVPRKLIGVEITEVACNAMKSHAESNGFGDVLDVVCEYLTPGELVSLLLPLPHIDLLHIDIQGGEYDLLAAMNAVPELRRKVKRVMMGTHGGRVKHDWAVNTLLAWGWTPVQAFPPSDVIDECEKMVVGRSLVLDPVCWTDTPLGPVYVRDGILHFRNPAFV